MVLQKTIGDRQVLVLLEEILKVPFCFGNWKTPRHLLEPKNDGRPGDETQIAKRAVAAAGLANEIEVLMATGRDPRILKKAVQQKEGANQSKLDVAVETAAKAACHSARDLMKDPVRKCVQTKDVQKTQQTKLRQHSVTKEEKPLAVKKAVEDLIGGNFDYDLMFQELRNIQAERKKIEQRVKAHPLNDHYIEMGPVMHNQRGAKDEKSRYLHGTTLESQAHGLGGKHCRSTCSPTRETHRKFLRSTLGRTQPILGPRGHKSLSVAQPVADGELLQRDIYKKELMGNDNAEKRELLKTNKHYRQLYIQANKKLQTTGGANGKQEQGVEVPRKNCKVPTWVDRMAKGRSCYEVSEFKHKNMHGNYTMRIPLKRLSVRPPGSIFKSSTIVQWKAEPNVVRKQESWRSVRHKLMRKRSLISLDKQRETVEKRCMDVNTCLKASKDNVLPNPCLFANNKPPKSRGLKVIKPINGRSKGIVIQERESEDQSVDRSKSDMHHCKDNPPKLLKNFMGLGKPQTESEEIDPERKNKLKNGTNRDGQAKEINFEISAAGDGTKNQLLLEPEVMESLAMDVLESKLNVCTKQAKEHEDSSLLPESPDSELVMDRNSNENEELQRTLLEIAIQSILKNESLKKVQDDASTCARETEPLQHPIWCSNQKGHPSGHGHSCEAIQEIDMHTLAPSSFPQSNLPVFFPTYVPSNGHLLPSLLPLHPSSGFSQFSPAVLSPAHVQSQSTPSKIARRPRKIRRSVCRTMDRWNKKRPRRPEEGYLSSPTTPSTPLTSPGHEGRIKKVLAPFSELEDVRKQEVFTSTDDLKGISTADMLTRTESPRINDVSTGTECADRANDSMVTERVKPEDAPTKTKGFKNADASTRINSINIDDVPTVTDDAKMIKDASTKTAHINIAVASMGTENVPLVDASVRTGPVKVTDVSTRKPDLPVGDGLTRINHEKLTDASTGMEGVRMADVSTATEALQKIIRMADSSNRTDYIKIADASMQVMRKAAGHVATSADDLNTNNRREPSESAGACGMLQAEGIRPLEVPQRQHSRNASFGRRLLDPKTSPLLRNSGLGMQRSNFQNLNPNLRRKKTGIDPADQLRKKSILRSVSSSDESRTVDSDSTSLTSSSASLGELSSKAYEATAALPPSLLTQRIRGTPRVALHTSVQPYMSPGQSQFPVSQASARHPSIQAHYGMGNSSFKSSDVSEGEIAPRSEWADDGEPGELPKMHDAILGGKEPGENGTGGEHDAISICSKSSSAGQRSINDRQSAMKALHEIFSPQNQHPSNVGQSCSEGEISPGCLSK